MPAQVPATWAWRERLARDPDTHAGSMQREHGTQSTLGLHSLPDELLTRVLVHLPSARDFGRADGVCRAWHATGSPVEQALRQRIEGRDDALPAALPGEGSMVQRMCWFELLREAHAASGLVGVGLTASAAVDTRGRLIVWGRVGPDSSSGHEVRIRQLYPTPMEGLHGVRVTRVCLGWRHALMLTDTG